MSVMPAQCPQCQSPVPSGASEGLCPRCLLVGGLAWQEVPPPEEEVPVEVLPRRFGEYELEERLAEGGMGVVYRARHTALGRTVALKTIRAGHFAGAEELRRFRQEARAAAQLDHPHVVPVYEVGEQGGVHFFTMKLAAGGCLKLSAPLLPAEAAALTARIARAVHFAHQHGVLHRDLKPSNILLEATGEPMVGDFGLAHIAQSGPDITLSGAVVGTPAYMAPEQARGVCTTASDVYSLGALLYALLAARAPFSGRSHYEIMRCVVEEEPRALSLPRPARDVEAICQKCMRKEAADRYASAEALAEDLERWLRGEPVAARAVSRGERLLKWARRRPAQAALLAVSTLGASGFLVFKIVSERRLREERNYAQEQEGKARTSAGLAAESERGARLQLYAADIFLADNALTDGDYGLARTALAAHEPRDGSPDLRGFEWYCLRRLCEGDKAQEFRSHTDAVTAVSFNKEGTRLLTSGRDGQVFVHDLISGSVVLTIPSAEDRVRTIKEHSTLTPVFLRSPEAAKLLLTGGEAYNRLFGLMRPSSVGDVRAAVFSPDGTTIATGSQWSWMRVWDAKSAGLVWVSPAVDCRCLTFADEGRKLITGDLGSLGEPRQIRILDTVTHQVLTNLDNTSGIFALSADGKTLAVPHPDNRMELRDPATGEVRAAWDAGVRLQSVTISANGQRLGGISEDSRQAFLWTADGQRTGPLSADGAILRAVSLSCDGTVMATAGADHAVHLWNGPDGKLLRTLRGHGDEVLAVAFSPNGRKIATGCRDQVARLYDLVKLVKRDRGVKSDNPVLITGDRVIENSKDGSVRTGLLTGPERTALPSGKERTVLCALADHEGFVTHTRRQPEIEFWKLDGTLLHPALTLETTAAPGTAAATACGALIAATGAPKELTFHSFQDGHRLRRVSMPWSATRLQFSPDGTLLMAFSWPHNFAILRSTTGEIVSQWQVPGAEVGPFTFSRDGTIAALGGTDNLVSIYQIATGQRLTVLRGHKSDIKSAAFSPDGHTLATYSDSRTLKLWHVPTWRELATLSRDGVFSYLQFSPENDTLYAWDYDKNLHRFTAPRE